MNIVLLNALDYGGAGAAALRLHQSLLDLGADSTLLVLDRTTRVPRVEVAPPRRGDDGRPPWRIA